MTRRGLRVDFAIRDVIFPPPDAVLKELHEHDVICGEVLDVSAGAANETMFVVVRVDGMETPVVVPVDRLRQRREG